MQGEDANGNKTMDMPVTNIKYVEGAESVVTSIEQGDGTIKVTTKIDGEVTEKEIEAGKVKSVNGKTGDVVVDVGVTSVNNKTGAVTLKESPSDMTDYIIESYRNGTEWYEIYKSGKVRQGGKYTGSPNSNITVTLHKPFANTEYSVFRANITSVTDGISAAYYAVNTLTTTSFKMYAHSKVSGSYWVAEGQGA